MISALQEMEHNHPRATPDPDHWPSRDDLDEMASLAAFRDQIVALEAYDA